MHEKWLKSATNSQNANDVAGSWLDLCPRLDLCPALDSRLHWYQPMKKPESPSKAKVLVFASMIAPRARPRHGNLTEITGGTPDDQRDAVKLLKSNIT